MTDIPAINTVKAKSKTQSLKKPLLLSNTIALSDDLIPIRITGKTSGKLIMGMSIPGLDAFAAMAETIVKITDIPLTVKITVMV